MVRTIRRIRKEGWLDVQFTLVHFLIFIGVVLILYLLWILRGVVVTVFIGFLISALLRNVSYKLDDLTRHRLPIKFWYTLMFLLFYLVFLIVIFQAGFIFINETVRFLQEFSGQGVEHMVSVLDRIFPGDVKANVDSLLQSFLTRLINAEVTWGSARFLFDFVPYLLLMFFSSWYLLQDREKIVESILLPIRQEHLRRKLFFIFFRLEEELGKWAKGQMILMLAIGVITYLGLKLLGVKYAFALATIAGLLEVIPTFGPVISAIPALAVGLMEGGITMGIWVVLLYLVIQQLENSFLVPKVMSTVIGIHPFFVILAIMVGQGLFGPIGGVLAVPVYVFVHTLLVVFESMGNLKPTQEGNKIPER